MKKVFFFTIILTILFVSCSENNLTDNKEEINFNAYQISGCNNSFSLNKQTTFADSCFEYSFNDTLKIDFCVFGNCCPDSNRFDVSHNLKSDTIYVTVSDTAANLCYCTCNYIIHLEFTGLQKDQYVFYSNFDSILIYTENISKLEK